MYEHTYVVRKLTFSQYCHTWIVCIVDHKSSYTAGYAAATYITTYISKHEKNKGDSAETVLQELTKTLELSSHTACAQPRVRPGVMLYIPGYIYPAGYNLSLRLMQHNLYPGHPVNIYDEEWDIWTNLN